MLYHFIPKYYADNRTRVCQLIDFEVPELSIKLNQHDLKTHKPYPNKHYRVGCLRKGYHGRNYVGLIFESKYLKKFSKICKWAIHDNYIADFDLVLSLVVEHITHYTLIDDKYDLFSDDLRLLYPWQINDKNYINRTNGLEVLKDSSVMHFLPDELIRNVSDKYIIEHAHIINEKIVLGKRMQTIELATSPSDIYTYLCSESEFYFPPLP